MAKKNLTSHSAINHIRPLHSPRCPYLFRIALREEEDGDPFTDLPDSVMPFGDDWRWFITTENVIYIAPFSRRGHNKRLLEIDSDNLLCTFSDPSVAEDSRGWMETSTGGVAPMFLIKCLKNGKTQVTLRVKNQEQEGRFLFSKTFELFVNNPEWPGTFGNDVHSIGVVL